MSHKGNNSLMHLHVELMHNDDYDDMLKHLSLPINGSSFYYAYNKKHAFRLMTFKTYIFLTEEVF